MELIDLLDKFDALPLNRWREIRDLIDMAVVNDLLEQTLLNIARRKRELDLDHRQSIVGEDLTTRESWNKWVTFNQSNRAIEAEEWSAFKRTARPLIRQSYSRSKQNYL